MASELNCETCGLPVPADTGVCPRDGTVALAAFHVPPPAPASPGADEPKVIVQSTLEASAESMRDPLIGLKLGEYELRARVGVGGMGLVYEGIQPLIGKRVAVKVLRPELAHSTEQVERLLAEARAVNAIRHRGIIDIFGFGQVPDGRQYIVMEYLEGQPLDAVLSERTRLPVLEALPILDEVLAALAAAHGAGVVHRDLKPSNIFMVHQPDGSRYVKVLDFGLAKRGQGPTGRTAQTRTDMVVGTPEYMAPEQARGQEVGPMTDLYALGVVTFEMVTGRLPFIGSSPVDLLMKHVEARPPRPSEFVPDLPPALDAFILQMLTKDPEARPNSADALRQQLHKLRRSLRSTTHSNASALAPTHPKPSVPDAAASHRPTAPVPAPTELGAERGLRPTAVLDAPTRKHLPVAVAVGTAVLLLAGGAALIMHEPARAVPLTPQREVDVRAGRLAAEARDDAHAERLAAKAREDAQAERLAAATDDTARVEHPVVDAENEARAGQLAVATGDAARAGQQVPVEGGSVGAAALGEGQNPGSTTPEQQVPTVAGASGQPGGPLAAASAPTGAPPESEAEDAMKSEGSATTAKKSLAVKSSRATRPTPEAPETLAPTERPSSPSKSSALPLDTQSRARVLKRIESLEDALPELMEQERVTSPDAMINSLATLRTAAKEASDAEALRNVQVGLDHLERVFIKKD
ncbi:protein kinase [Myxococcus sp. K38C18041901]|uniref:protein kinase domain-containing protein n=1 Tax=Myxococcus guangdongensis TaxID=2906760 RepID=UPI0020A8245B|nr:protein kinase [Myxococcus guangdongensis]MCP3058943.1 protein kinase [Myxococcus guangdongensis]